MISLTLRLAVVVLSTTFALQAAPDISNLNNCIKEVRHAANSAPQVLTFDSYTTNYGQLIADLNAAIDHLPHVYQEAAAKPLIQFLENLGESRFLDIFSGNATDEEAGTLQQIIPDAALSVLLYDGPISKGVNAFQEIVSDIYDGFLGDEARINKHTDKPINPPTYGSIPPLVKFGNPDAGPYTWPADATAQILGMHCGVVSLPPSQLKGGLIAWSSLGHETGGHDVTHSDAGLLDELAQKVYDAILGKFQSEDLAKYWARCIDESSADVCGYLNIGPSFGVGLIGYFRALGNGKLRSVGSSDDPHPIDLLRGYLGAAVVKRLGFKDAHEWSEVITKETSKDNDTLSFVDQEGNYSPFPVSFENAVASTDVVAQIIAQAKLTTLQDHALQELQNWTDHDQEIVDHLVSVLKSKGQLPSDLRGPGFFASYVVAASTQAALEHGSNISTIFNEMQNFLATMHEENPTWSKSPTNESLALLEKGLKGGRGQLEKAGPHIVIPKLPQTDNVLVGQL